MRWPRHETASQAFSRSAGARRRMRRRGSPLMSGLRPKSYLVLVEALDLALRQRVEVKHEADDGGRGVGGDIREPIEADGVDGKDVAVQVVPRKRTRSAVARGAEVSARLQRASWQGTRLGAASTGRELRDAGRDVDYHPVPETATGRRVRVKRRHREA